MLKIALCMGEAEQRAALDGLVRDYLARRPELTARVFAFDSGPGLLGAAEDGSGFDLYLLDVLMPETSGIELGVRLRELGERGAIIYLSDTPDYAVESYRVRAFDFLLKPPAAARLFPVLDQALASLDRRRTSCVMVKTRWGMRLISLDDILYMELAGRTVRCHLAGGEEVSTMTLRASFQDAVAPLLADSRFIRCGASFVVNLYYVTAVEHGCFYLEGGGRIPLPRRLVSSVKQAWSSYWLSSG